MDRQPDLQPPVDQQLFDSMKPVLKRLVLDHNFCTLEQYTTLNIQAQLKMIISKAEKDGLDDVVEDVRDATDAYSQAPMFLTGLNLEKRELLIRGTLQSFEQQIAKLIMQIAKVSLPNMPLAALTKQTTMIYLQLSHSFGELLSQKIYPESKFSKI